MNMNTITLLCLLFTSINHAAVKIFNQDLSALNDWAKSAEPPAVAPEYYVQITGDGYFEFKVIAKIGKDYYWRFEMKDGELREYVTCDSSGQPLTEPRLIKTRYFENTDQSTIYNFTFKVRKESSGFVTNGKCIKLLVRVCRRGQVYYDPAVESEWNEVQLGFYKLEFHKSGNIKSVKSKSSKEQFTKSKTSKSSTVHSIGAVLFLVCVSVFLMF